MTTPDDEPVEVIDPVDKVVEEIDNWLEGTKVGEPKFMAMADSLDFALAKSDKERSESEIQRLIDEQKYPEAFKLLLPFIDKVAYLRGVGSRLDGRRNEIVGYNGASNRSDSLIRKLHSAVDANLVWTEEHAFSGHTREEGVWDETGSIIGSKIATLAAGQSLKRK